MEIKGYKCPCCSAPLTFDGASQQMTCSSCDNSFEVSLLEQFKNETADSDRESTFDWSKADGEQIEGTVVYTCPSCGGEIIGDSVTAATKCPYCDNVAIMNSQVSGMLKPDVVIPFKTTKEQAIAALKQFYKGKKLLPDSFKNENRIKEIKGIYVPFWLFDCEAQASITYDATRVSSWVAGDYRYTKTDHFAAVREGELGFCGLPVDASSKMDDAFMDSIEPYDYSAAVPFETAYLSGYLADKFDVDTQESFPRANTRIKNTTEDVFRSTVMGYSAVSTRNSSIRTNNGNIRYALLPVWILNTKYEGKLYTFAMNGQTGKIIGNLPIDKKKTVKYFFAAFGICAAVVSALLLLGGIIL